MAGPSRPPFPSAPSDPSLRRLGVGRDAQRERPLRAQLVVALVAGLILLAVPLYLWRRPASSEHVAPEASAPSASVRPLVVPVPLAQQADASLTEPERVKIGPIRRVRCGASRRRASSSEICDSLGVLEKKFVDAIEQTVDCAPRKEKGGSINFVLEVDFLRKSWHVFPGASGDWRGPAARRACRCVSRAITVANWTSVVHRYGYYAVAALATYPPVPKQDRRSTQDGAK